MLYIVVVTNSNQTKKGWRFILLQLKGYRIMCGYTQEDLSKYLGCSRPLYTYKENGDRSFTGKEKIKILKLFKKKIPDLTIEKLFPNEY